MTEKEYTAEEMEQITKYILQKRTLTVAAVIKCTFAACITVAACYFNNPAILCWYVLAAIAAPVYEIKPRQPGANKTEED